MRKLIKVRARHIKAGIQNKSTSCPVALAIREQINAGVVDVFMNEISINQDYGNTADMPRSVSRFVDKFDKNGKRAVKPFNFYLDVPISASN